MTLRVTAGALGFVLAAAMAVDAHQLDEYLQATRLSIGRDRIVVDLTLTPGVSIAPRVFAAIDSDRDGRISPPEIEKYARQVVADLSLAIDGHQRPLALVRADSSSWEEIAQGAGTIRALAEVEAPALVRGTHQLRYENIHESASGVYLVNALAPSDRNIVIRAQRRDRQQHSIELDVEIGGSSYTLGSLGMLAVAIAALTGFRGIRAIA